jgi:hypothetical protein
VHEGCLEHVERFLATYASALTPGSVVGDFGSMDVNGSPRGLVEGRGLKYVGYDIAAGPNVDVVLDERNPKWFIEAINGALCLNTLEHTSQPWELVRFIADMLHRDSPVLLVAPAVWCFHEHPKDRYRYWPDGLRDLAEYAGIEVETCRLVKYSEDKQESVLMGRVR